MMIGDQAGGIGDEIRKSFELTELNLVSKDKIIEALSFRIRDLMTKSPSRLYSLLYRLDISERKIKEVLGSGGNVALGLSELVYQRQSEKAESRKRFKEKRPDDDLAW